VAVAALTEDGHYGQTYDITGPEALSFGDAAGILSEVSESPSGTLTFRLPRLGSRCSRQVSRSGS